MKHNFPRRPSRRQRHRGLEGDQGLVEYALILVLVAVVAIVVLTALGAGVSNTFQNITCSPEQQTDCVSPSSQAVAMEPDLGSGGNTTRTNHTPVMSPVAAQAVDEGQTLTLNLSAADADNDPLVFNASCLNAAFMTFQDNGDGTARLTLTPGYDHAGGYTVGVNVTAVHSLAGGSTLLSLQQRSLTEGVVAAHRV